MVILIPVVSALLDRPRTRTDDTMDPSAFPPEYVNASNAGRIVGVVGVFHFLALTFVSLRLYVRVFMVRAFGVDDALIVASCVRIMLVSSTSNYSHR